MGFYDEIPLFVDTNLDTHLALSVSQDITAGDLKGKLGMEHFSCFPNYGQIKVHGLMVKKKSLLYHFSDSMAIKHLFNELSGTRLLHLNASLKQNALSHDDNQSQKSASLNSSSRNNLKRNVTEQNNPVEANKWVKNREVKLPSAPGFNTDHQNENNFCKSIQNDKITVSEQSLTNLENSSKISQTISVSCIISRFFSELDEVDSSYYQLKHNHQNVQFNQKSQPDHISNRKSVLSDINTHCSFVKKREENTVERAKVDSKVKKLQLGSKKQVDKKSSICKSHISLSSKSCKYQVGKRVVQAANTTQQISGRGKSSATKFLSKFKYLNRSDSALFAKGTPFDVDDFVS